VPTVFILTLEAKAWMMKTMGFSHPLQFEERTFDLDDAERDDWLETVEDDAEITDETLTPSF
jgi:hypothetical protein